MKLGQVDARRGALPDLFFEINKTQIGEHKSWQKY